MELKKTLLDHLAWLIPNSKLRNSFRFNVFFPLEIDYFMRYLKYKKDVKDCPTFFVRNDWERSSLDFENNFLFQRIKENFLPNLKISLRPPDIEFFGPLGSPKFVKKSKAKIKIFFTGECVDNESINKMWKQYSDNLVNDVDISMGFNRLDESKHENYIRFPLWLLYHFHSILHKNTTKDDIAKRVKGINETQFPKTKFGSLVAGHDQTNIRQPMYDAMSKIDYIHAPGNFIKNDPSLKGKYNNDKQAYLKEFKFNICAENTISDGYITEKIFDAFSSGCIPIYSGDKKLEPNVINTKSVLFWEKNANNECLLKEIENLHKNQKLYDAFIKEKKLLDSATDFIWNRREKVLNRLEHLIEKKMK